MEKARRELRCMQARRQACSPWKPSCSPWKPSQAARAWHLRHAAEETRQLRCARGSAPARLPGRRTCALRVQLLLADGAERSHEAQHGVAVQRAAIGDEPFDDGHAWRHAEGTVPMEGEAGGKDAQRRAGEHGGWRAACKSTAGRQAGGPTRGLRPGKCRQTGRRPYLRSPPRERGPHQVRP